MLKASNFRLRLRALELVAAMALVSASCRPGGTPASVDAGDNADAPVPAGLVALELTNAPVDEVLQKLAAAAGKAFVIDPDAQFVAHCARISLLTGGKMPTAKALDLVREALEASALTMVESATGGIVVRRNHEKPLPTSCQGSSVLNLPEPESSASSEASDKFSLGVREISATEYEVNRTALDLLLENPANMARTARVIPQMHEGKMVGMKLFGIRAKSPLSTIGLKNGDTITHVDGQTITSPDEALKVYAGLAKAKKVELTIDRKGETLKMVYRLKDK